jgi:acetyl-CoA acetyltransferase
VPVTVPRPRGESAVVTADEHPRPETTQATLARLKGLVRPDGSVTAGNSSGVNDGAGAVLVASEAAARRHGLTPMARVVAAVSAGVAPRVMGLGPVPAIRKVLARAGLAMADADVLELYEAFAA